MICESSLRLSTGLFVASRIFALVEPGADRHDSAESARAAIRLVDAARRCRMLVKCGRRPDGAGNQVAAAVRTSSGENMVGAIRAERAFE